MTYDPQNLADALTVNADDPEYMKLFTDRLSFEAIGHILARLPVCDDLRSPRASQNRTLALDVADILGEDRAQALYHFVVLVTKLARK